MIVLEEAQYVAMHLPRLAQQADDALLGRLGAGSGTLWVRIPFESVRGLHGPLGSSAPCPPSAMMAGLKPRDREALRGYAQIHSYIDLQSVCVQLLAGRRWAVVERVVLFDPLTPWDSMRRVISGPLIHETD